MAEQGLIERNFGERLKKDHWPEGGYPFITISHQAGAGGRRLAEAIRAETQNHAHHDLFFGWQVFDQEICEEILRNKDVHISEEDLVSEVYRSDLEDFIHEILSGKTSQYKVMDQVFSLVTQVAEMGKVILVGRAANFVTRHLPGKVHLRVHANHQERVEHMSERFNIDTNTAAQRIRNYDRHQHKMVDDLYNAEVEDPLNYDMVWNTSRMAISELARISCFMMENRARDIGRWYEPEPKGVEDLGRIPY